MEQVVEVPFPLDMYTVALEEFLLIEALSRLMQQQGRGTLPPAIGLAPVNDILVYAQLLLDAPGYAALLQYSEDLNRSRFHVVDAYLPEPAPVLDEKLLAAEAMARAFLAEGHAPIWSAVRQVVGLLEWQPDKHSVAPGKGCNVMLGAYSKGPFRGLCKAARSHASVCRLLNRLVQHMGCLTYWSTLAVNLDLRLLPQKDSGNYPSGSLVLSLTHHVNGGLWIEDVTDRPQQQRKCGAVYRMDMRGLFFPAHEMVHATCDWSGTRRIVLTAFCVGQVDKLDAGQREILHELGFLLPFSGCTGSP